MGLTPCVAESRQCVGVCRLTRIYFELGSGLSSLSFPTCETGLVPGRLAFSPQGVDSSALAGTLLWFNQEPMIPGLISSEIEISFAGDTPLQEPLVVCIPPLPEWATHNELVRRGCLASLRSDNSYSCTASLPTQFVDGLLCSPIYEEGRFALVSVEVIPSSASWVTVVLPVLFLGLFLAF